MNQSIGLLVCLGLLGMSACSSAAHDAAAPLLQAPPTAPVTRAASANRRSSPETLRAHQTAAPLEYHDEDAADRAFIENAERAIGQYSEFLARAGNAAEYAPAVKRSREQIEDLRAAIEWVRAGAAQRAAH